MSRPMVLAWLSLLACNPHISQAASDILLVNGNVYTASISSPWAQAIAITGSRIDAIGSNSVVNAKGNLEEIRAYAALRDRGELTVRTRTPFGTVAVNHELSQQFRDQLEEARTLQDDEWVTANLIKFFADGAGDPPLYEPAHFRELVLELGRRGYTRSSAYGAHTNELFGSMEPGKMADLVVLRQDIFKVPATSIGNMQVVLTMVGGRIVFDQMKIRH